MRLARQFALIGIALAVPIGLPLWQMAQYALQVGHVPLLQRTLLFGLAAAVTLLAAYGVLLVFVLRPIAQVEQALAATALGQPAAPPVMRGLRDVRDMLQAIPALVAASRESAELAATLQELRSQLTLHDTERAEHNRGLRELLEAMPFGVSLHGAGWQLHNRRWQPQPDAPPQAVIDVPGGERVEIRIEQPPLPPDREQALREIAAAAEALRGTDLDLDQQCRVEDILAATRGAEAAA